MFVSMFANHHICIVLRSSVHHISGWNCPQFMHKSKYTYILVQGISYQNAYIRMQSRQKIPCPFITLLRFITMCYGTDNITWNIPSFRLNVEYYQSHRTMLRICCVMLCSFIESSKKTSTVKKLKNLKQI